MEVCKAETHTLLNAGLIKELSSEQVTRLFLLILIFSCNNESLIKDFSTDENYSVETTTNASITHTINGKLKAKIDVGKMERFNKNQIIYFDLLSYVKFQLKSCKISKIDVIKIDTFNEKNNFFSARRSLKLIIDDYGRNISIIMIN